MKLKGRKKFTNRLFAQQNFHSSRRRYPNLNSESFIGSHTPRPSFNDSACPCGPDLEFSALQQRTMRRLAQETLSLKAQTPQKDFLESEATDMRFVVDGDIRPSAGVGNDSGGRRGWGGD
ncbi:hypothetical protein AVEN_200791-1 [Araneus ventricosus]|uniref:Uncharacterized protein n=1 Tax=Araneus ventricosus TaxID=182803 RepID=A0A4Y2DW33_ARAVE|nr:hypothetical protein AVEN_200791-1 [Araneus ventricosus]